MGDERPESPDGTADEHDSDEDNPFARDVERFDSKEEFINAAFESVEDYPAGATVPEWWDWEGEAPEYEQAEQVTDDMIRYVYRGYPVELRRDATSKFEAVIATDGAYGYNDVEYLQWMHEIPTPSRIAGAFGGKVVIETYNFGQHHAIEAVEAFVDEEIATERGQEQLADALDSFTE